ASGTGGALQTLATCCLPPAKKRATPVRAIEEAPGIELLRSIGPRMTKTKRQRAIRDLCPTCRKRLRRRPSTPYRSGLSRPRPRRRGFGRGRCPSGAGDCSIALPVAPWESLHSSMREPRASQPPLVPYDIQIWKRHCWRVRLSAERPSHLELQFI